MSTPLAGKFQDPYAVLGVDSNADTDAIHRAYRTLASKYHPVNGATPDKEKYSSVTQAYEVLSDPAARKALDSVRTAPEQESAPQFSGAKFFEAITREAGRRFAILCVLYDRRQQKPLAPALAVRQLEAMLASTPEEMTLTIWYLKQKSFIKSDDKSSLQVTMEGMEYLEKNVPPLDLIEPFLKPYDPNPPARKPSVAATPASHAKPAAAEPAAQPVSSGWRLPTPHRTGTVTKHG